MHTEKEDKKKTRQKLLEQAKVEFADKGFMKASLRTICTNSGVTTGALYFFFKDKEDLFSSLVQEPLQNVNAILLMYYQEQKARVASAEFDPSDDSASRETCEKILQELFAHREEFLLLLTKAQGSRLEQVQESFAMILSRQNRILADAITQKQGLTPVGEELVDWLSHMYVDAFAFIMKHASDREGADRYFQQIFPYLRNGWRGIFQKN